MCKEGIYCFVSFLVPFLSFQEDDSRGLEGGILRRHPNIHPINHNLSPLIAILEVPIAIRRGRRAICPDRIQSRNGDDIALEDDKPALSAVVVQDWWAGVEGGWGARLVVGEEDEGGGFGGGVEGFHIRELHNWC